jgi:hypothetical protein
MKFRSTFKPKLIREPATSRPFTIANKEIRTQTMGQPTILAVNVTELGGMLPDLMLAI